MYPSSSLRFLALAETQPFSNMTISSLSSVLWVGAAHSPISWAALTFPKLPTSGFKP